ncbi:hypothetical protein NC653_009808 [Populus alba x Populus x berolinensis]|uniref:Disease resistance N-terminal domain-containing protein n=1 Tax=Populus alba x Populus x berolinensis TaxID=444605 RepID=A0AAD6R9X7_9ROSI|nr:hypothetical protein NC653_009808 [Populus alba x Populus x berolinensis]
MALAVIGESILAAVLEVLMERIVSPAVRDFFKSQKIDDEELKKLKARMRSVSKLLNDAEEKQITDAAVKEWLDELKDAVYQADDFLDEIAYKMTRVIFYSVGYYLPKHLPEGLAYILLILQSLACLGRGSGPKEQRGEGSLRMLSYFQM